MFLFIAMFGCAGCCSIHLKITQLVKKKKLQIENKKIVETPNSFLFSSQLKIVLKTVVQMP
jgi:hypothetical protein